MNEAILQEVPLPAPAIRPEGSVNLPPVSIPPVSTSHFTIPSAEKCTISHQNNLLNKQLVNQWTKIYKPDALKSQHSGNHILVHLHQQTGGSMGFNVTTPVTQATQAQIPQFLNFIGSSSGVPQAAVQAPASVEGNTTIFNLPKTVGFPPQLLDEYGRQMRKVRGTTKLSTHC